MEALKGKSEEVAELQKRTGSDDDGASDEKLKAIEEAKQAVETQLSEAQESYSKLEAEHQEHTDLLKTIKDEVCIYFCC